MAVQRNIPLSGDVLSDSQGDLLGNSQGYFDTFMVDHTSYDASNAGLHNKCTFPGIASDPITTGAQGIVYGNVTSATPPRMDLFYKYQTNAGSSLTGLNFPLNFVKACCLLTPGAPYFIAETAFNIAGVAYNGTLYTITLATAITSVIDRMMVFVSGNNGSTNNAVSYNITTTTTVTVVAPSSQIVKVSFMACSLEW